MSRYIPHRSTETAQTDLARIYTAPGDAFGVLLTVAIMTVSIVAFLMLLS